MSSIAYPDPKLSPEQRADVLLKDMTPNEKMAQVNCVFPYGGVEYDFDWKIEKGDFSVRIGASSEDIRAEGSFRIIADAWIDGKTRSMVAEAEVKP